MLLPLSDALFVGTNQLRSGTSILVRQSFASQRSTLGRDTRPWESMQDMTIPCMISRISGSMSQSLKPEEICVGRVAGSARWDRRRVSSELVLCSTQNVQAHTRPNLRLVSQLFTNRSGASQNIGEKGVTKRIPTYVLYVLRQARQGVLGWFPCT